MAILDLQVGASADDDVVTRSTSYWTAAGISSVVGRYNATYNMYGGSFRFTGVNIPAGATLTANMTYLTLVAVTTYSGTVVRSDLTFENFNNPGQMTSYANHIGRTRATPVAYDGVPATTAGEPYQLPPMVSPLQEVIDAQGGTGNAVIAFWEDKDNESDAGAFRDWATWDHTTLAASLLHIEYTEGGGTAVPVFEHHYRMIRGM